MRENIRVRIHEGVAHGGPMIVSVIEIAGPRLFLVIARVQRGIEGGDRRFDRPPFPLAALIFRYPGLGDCRALRGQGLSARSTSLYVGRSSVTTG